MAYNLKTRHSKDDLLSLSYDEGVERIAGVKDDLAFAVPYEIICKRKKFWNELFDKYTEQVSDETEIDIRTLKPCAKQSVCKSLGFVQYWVNTGYLPYNKQKFGMDEDMQSDTAVSLSEDCLSLTNRHGIEEKSNLQYIERTYYDNSSSSSVDTAAYILSNTNTTNKEETMAIVEGAKHSKVNSQCIKNVEMTQVATDKEYKDSNKAVVTDNNGNNYEHHSIISSSMSQCKSQQKDTDVEKNVQRRQEALDADVRKNTLSEVVNMDVELIGNCKTYNIAPLNKEVSSPMSDNRSGDSYTKPNLWNVHSPQTKRNYFTVGNTLLQDSITKNKNRKKLYTGSDSPVDLLNVKNNKKHIISKTKQSLHPALDVGYKLSKKYKMFKKRSSNSFLASNNSLIKAGRVSVLSYNKLKRRKRRKKFDETCSTSINITRFDNILPKNLSIMDDSIVDKSSIEHDSFQCVNKKISNNESQNTKSTSSMLTNCTEKDKMKTYKNANTRTKNVKSLNPLVYLKRLSKVEIEKYKRSKNLCATQLSGFNYKKDRKLKKIKKNLRYSNPTVRLMSSPELDVQNFKKPDKKFTRHGSLNPVVLLTPISQSEIQKCKKVPNTVMNLGNLNPVVRLQRLSKADIQKQTDRKTENESALSSEPVVLQNHDQNNDQSAETSVLNCSNFPNIIHLTCEDTTSNQSSLLICKCSSVSPDDHSTSALSALYSNKSQTDVFMEFSSPVVKTKLKLNERKAELKSKVPNTGEDIIENKVFESIATIESKNDNGSRNKTKRVKADGKPKCVARKQSIKNKNNVKRSSTMNLRSSIINENLSRKKSVYESDTASSSDKSEANSKNKNNSVNDKKKAPILLLSDEDEEFVKLVYCPEDVQELKLRRRYKKLNQNFNNIEEESKSDRSDVITNSTKCLRKTVRRFTSCKTFLEDDSSPIKVSSLGQTNKELRDQQTVLKSSRKTLSNVGSTNGRIKSKVSHLCFKTKIFDSDSESFTA